MIEVPSWAMGLLISLVGLAFTGMGFFYARIRNAEVMARERGVIVTKLDVLEKKVDTMIAGNVAQQQTCSSRGERLALVEASAKSAHHRIDALEKKGG